MNLTIKDYNKGDEAKIIDLFLKVFQKEMTKSYWNWRYDKGIINEKYIKLAWDNDVLAAHYAVCPVYLSIDKSIEKTGFSMTTMTNSNYQKLGLFRKLAKKLYDDNFGNLKIIWGFPNNNSLHGFIKHLNWNHIKDINMLTMDLKNLKSNDCNNIVEKDCFDESYDDFFKKFMDKYKIIVVRNQKYLNWRYIENPSNHYTLIEYRENDSLKGYCVFKLFNAGDSILGDIVDVLAENVDVFRKLILDALHKLKDENAVGANIWMNNKEFRSELMDIGFKESDTITHFGVKINSDIDKDTLLNFDNWYLTLGDSDVF